MAKTDFDKIDLLVLDVDGVLTDGRITLTPDGEEIKSFNVRDGAGMKYFKRVGHKLAIITGRGGEVVRRRAEELGVDAVRMHCKDKLPALREVCEELGIAPERAASIGDDLTDIPVARAVGFSVAVADAADELKAVVHHVTERPGGAGAVREVIELILKEAGSWETILQRYLPPPEESAT